MNPILVIWILAILCAIFVGREIGRWLFGENTKLQTRKREAQVLAGKLRAAGLKWIPSLLEDFAVGDLQDMFEKIHDLSKVAEAGSDAIEKELEGTYERVLDAKLQTPEGLAVVKAKIAVVEADAKK